MRKRAKESGKRIQLILSAVKVRPRVRRHACNFKGNARQFAFNLPVHHESALECIFLVREQNTVAPSRCYIQEGTSLRVGSHNMMRVIVL